MPPARVFAPPETRAPAFVIFAWHSRSDSGLTGIARYMLSGKITSLTSVAVTLIPQGSLCRLMISCSLTFILSRWAEQFIEFRLSEYDAQSGESLTESIRKRCFGFAPDRTPTA
jgi:hypothetical protein